MKRLIAWLLMAVMLFTMASAESLTDEDYTDVPTAMTQDSVAELVVTENCLMEALQPDEESIALLDSVYRFVWEGKNRPARYYDVPTQEKISSLIGGGNIDILHMTEAMRLQLSGAPENTVTATMRLNVEYRVGQLIVVVLGIPHGGEYVWYPYRGRVETLGEIKWDIPVEDWTALCRQPISFHVLTDRIGPRGGRIWGYESYYEPGTPAFSKDAEDVRRMRWWYDEWGNRIEDDFRLWLVELTQPMQAEVARIGEHVAAGKPILDYFPAERKSEALMMLPADIAPADLVAYDIIAMMDENYKDTYGDVNAEVVFSTAYNPDKSMIILAGFANEDAPEEPFTEWYVLRAEALEDSEGAAIGLKQLFLPWMDEKPLMLVVISEPLDAE